MIDLHTHTLQSDGCKTPEELVAMAIGQNVKVLAITDHNRTMGLEELRRKFPEIRLVQGMEVSCRYVTRAGQQVTLHVVALGFDPNHPAIRTLIETNNGDRQAYVEAMLDRLKAYGMEMTYDEVRQANPETTYYGKKAVAVLMHQKGFVSSVDEALDVYIGSYGQRLAYVQERHRYVSLAEAISAIREAGGICILAHLYYYRLAEHDNRELLSRFKKLTQEDGGMEVYYGQYDTETREKLKVLSEEFGLMASAGSDYHGQSDADRLDHNFSADSCRELLDRLGVPVSIDHEIAENRRGGYLQR